MVRLKHQFVDLAVVAALVLTGCGESTSGNVAGSDVPEIVRHVSTDCDASDFDNMGTPLEPRCGAYSFDITVYPTGVMVTKVEGALAADGWFMAIYADDESDVSTPQEAIDASNAQGQEYWTEALSELGDDWRQFDTPPVGDYSTGVIGDYLDEIGVIQTLTLYGDVLHMGVVTDIDVVHTDPDFLGEDGSFEFEQFIDLQSLGNAQVSYTVRMPGEVLESDGKVTGNVVTWTQIQDMEYIRARSHGFDQGFIDAVRSYGHSVSTDL